MTLFQKEYPIVDITDVVATGGPETYNITIEGIVSYPEEDKFFIIKFPEYNGENATLNINELDNLTLQDQHTGFSIVPGDIIPDKRYLVVYRYEKHVFTVNTMPMGTSRYTAHFIDADSITINWDDYRLSTVDAIRIYQTDFSGIETRITPEFSINEDGDITVTFGAIMTGKVMILGV